MQAQEVFDTAVSGIIKQGRQSYSDTDNQWIESCLYRGPNGTKCAAGFLIPDEVYTPFLEGHNWGEISHKFPNLDKHKHLIESLQIIHDEQTSEDFLTRFKRQAKNLAKDKKLEWKYD